MKNEHEGKYTHFYIYIYISIKKIKETEEIGIFLNCGIRTVTKRNLGIQ